MWYMVSTTRIRKFPLVILPRTFPLPDNSPFYMVQDIPLFHQHQRPICNIKRSTVNVYKIDIGRSVRVRNTG